MRSLDELKHFMGAGLAAWRKAQKSGGIFSISELALMQMGDLQGFRQAYGLPTFDELEEMAESLDCEWAYNPNKKMYYFIPKEYMGGVR